MKTAATVGFSFYSTLHQLLPVHNFYLQLWDKAEFPGEGGGM